MEEFHRIRRLPPYVFEQVNRAKAIARNAGADIIDLGMGNPDLPAPAHVIEKLKETLGKPRTDRYSASQGHRRPAPRAGGLLRPPLRGEAQSRRPRSSPRSAPRKASPTWRRRSPRRATSVLVPNPSYPIHAFGFLMAGGVIRSVPSEPTPEFFATLERAIVHSIPKPLAVVVCYPSNPTAYVADLDFYQDLVPFAKKHGIFVLSDLAYAEVYFDDNPPPSVLQVPGAMDVAVEFTSMSKTFSMPGWRMGFAVGNERIIAALGAGEVLSRLRRLHAGPGGGDRGAQRPGRLHPRDARDLQAPARRAGRSFGRAGWEIPPPRASMFAWAPIPEPFRASAASSSPRCWSRRPRSRSRPASASASTATATCASRWSRTSSASARPPATSAAFLKPAPKSCTTSSPWPSGARRAASHRPMT